MSSFLAMGGYAFYVWSAYGLGLVVLVGLVMASRRRLRHAERSLAALEQARGPRARRRAPAPLPVPPPPVTSLPLGGDTRRESLS